MSFEFKKDEAISEGVRRIVCKQIDQALKTMTRRTRTVSDAAVHDARKRFKEIRGTIRLVRHELGEKRFRRENRAFRNAGRPLSALRDAKVLVDSLDGLIAHFDGRVEGERLGALRRALIARQRAARKQVVQRDRALPDIVRRLRAAKKRVKSWPLKKHGWKAVAGGLKRVYGQGRRAMKQVRSGGSDKALHEWRKRTKDLRYEIELLQTAWPETIRPFAEQIHRLTDLLGEDHDLAVLRAVACDELANRSPVDRELLFALIDERRTALQSEAIELGQEVYEESDKSFVARLEGYWKTARKNSARPC